jgi:hypothetical protein
MCAQILKLREFSFEDGINTRFAFAAKCTFERIRSLGPLEHTPRVVHRPTQVASTHKPPFEYTRSRCASNRVEANATHVGPVQCIHGANECMHSHKAKYGHFSTRANTNHHKMVQCPRHRGDVHYHAQEQSHKKVRQTFHEKGRGHFRHHGGRGVWAESAFDGVSRYGAFTIAVLKQLLHQN